jgi:hypothetical protein
MRAYPFHPDFTQIAKGRGAGIRPGLAKGGKVPHADQTLGRILHLVHIQWTIYPRRSPIEKDIFLLVEAIDVSAGNRRIARVGVPSDWNDGSNGYLGRQHPIDAPEGIFPASHYEMFRQVRVRHIV